MKKVLLIVVWAIVIANMFFLTDILYNYVIGNTQSVLSGATTEASQAVLAAVMNVMCMIILYFYTIILTDKERN